MSTLSSASSLDEIKAAYADNASYVEDDSTSKARAFVTACRLLLLRMPRRTVHGGRGSEELELQPELIQGELQRAETWLAARPAAGGGNPSVLHVSLASFR